MTMRKLPLLILFILLLPTLVSAAVFTDAVGRQVTLADTPQHIISLVPSVTETLFALGAEDKLAAVTDFCSYPEAAGNLPSVGSYADPGIEGILQQRPDLVIASADINSPALIEKISRLGIAVYVIHPSSITAALSSIRNIGELTGHRVQAEQLLSDIQNRLDAIQYKLKNRQHTRVLACVMLQPLTVAGPETFINDLVRLAGGNNIVEHSLNRYPTWNQESLLLANPEAIILPLHSEQAAARTFFAQWPQLQAVQNNRIIAINADWLYRPGPRLILGVEALARALHPDAFADE